MTLRHLISIAVLPGTVAVAVPLWISQRRHLQWTVPTDLRSAFICLAGALLLMLGAGLFGWSVYFFWSRGRGTLAPWDPPRIFVVEGPYRYVRNPMISGVIFMLIGEAGLLRSRPLLAWAALVAFINAVYIPVIEEPMLKARFGGSYDRYTRVVGRFIPRPWIREP
jgi:protein-S-isoprenylcysteine O-methyltransferase Ste14